jgi:hypothetical protein
LPDAPFTDFQGRHTPLFRVKIARVDGSLLHEKNMEFHEIMHF